MIGVVASFDTRDGVLRAIDRARAAGHPPATVFSPAYDAEILNAVGTTRSWVPAATLAGGIAGGASGLAFTVWIVIQWPVLRLGGKPLIAWPPFLIIAFELAILFAAVGAAAAFLLGCRRARRGLQAAYDRATSDAEFALLIRCAGHRAPELAAEMMRCGAKSWRLV